MGEEKQSSFKSAGEGKGGRVRGKKEGGEEEEEVRGGIC